MRSEAGFQTRKCISNHGFCVQLHPSYWNIQMYCTYVERFQIMIADSPAVQNWFQKSFQYFHGLPSPPQCWWIHTNNKVSMLLKRIYQLQTIFISNEMLMGSCNFKRFKLRPTSSCFFVVVFCCSFASRLWHKVEIRKQKLLFFSFWR